MRIIEHQIIKHEIDLCDYRNIHFIYIEVDDIQDCAKNIIESIQNTSWIEKLGIIGQRAYKNAALETSDKLLTIFTHHEEPISSDFGEYVISVTAGSSLKEILSHEVLPLAELWKEKKSGNHGFDFHTVTPQKYISFGEAKYSSKGSPYLEAIRQIASFISRAKADRDLPHLQILIEQEIITNYLNGGQCYCAAFSIQRGQHFKKIIRTVFDKDEFRTIINQGKEIFVVGIKICQSSNQ